MSAMASAYLSMLRKKGLKACASLTGPMLRSGHGSEVLIALTTWVVEGGKAAVPHPTAEDEEGFVRSIQAGVEEVFSSIPVLGKYYTIHDLIEQASIGWLQRCGDVGVHVSSVLGADLDAEERNRRCAVASQELVVLLERSTGRRLEGFFDDPNNKIELTSGQLEAFMAQATRVVYDTLNNPNAAVRRRLSDG